MKLSAAIAPWPVVAFALWLAISSAAAAADPVRAGSTIDRQTITAGDPVTLRVTVELDAGHVLIDSGVGGAIGDFEVLASAPVEREERGGVTRLAFAHRITIYRVGDHVIPAIAVQYEDPSGRRAVARTGEHIVRVTSVIAPGEDAADIRPLKPQLDLPGGGATLLVDALRLLTLGLAVAAVSVVATRAAHGALAARAALRLTARERALRELARIAELRLPEQQRYREHYELLAGCVRGYVVERFGIAARERTPRELRGEMARRGIGAQHAAAVDDVLTEGEIVRFGHFVPTPARAEGALRRAQDAIADEVTA